jgi:hypothetical protein
MQDKLDKVRIRAKTTVVIALLEADAEVETVLLIGRLACGLNLKDAIRHQVRTWVHPHRKSNMEEKHQLDKLREKYGPRSMSHGGEDRKWYVL